MRQYRSDDAENSYKVSYLIKSDYLYFGAGGEDLSWVRWAWRRGHRWEPARGWVKLKTIERDSRQKYKPQRALGLAQRYGPRTGPLWRPG